MKKYLALVLGVLFTLGFAASAFAIHAEIPAETQAIVAKGTTQVTLGGEIRLRGELRNNTDLDKAGGQVTATSAGENADTTSFYDGRVRLRIQADVSKNTMGVIHLESGGNAFKDTYTWALQRLVRARVRIHQAMPRRAPWISLKPGFSTNLIWAFLQA